MPKLPPRGTQAPRLDTPTDDSPVTMLDAALQWAKRGWPVFPLRPRRKEPLFPSAHPKGVKCKGECGRVGHGVLDATTDPDLIRKWWTKNPNANIGGATRGRVVLDFDYEHGAVRPPNLPATREHLSGRGNGNVHVVYLAQGDLGLGLTQGKLAQGVDLKAGPSAYVVLPPSVHPDGGQYEVANPDDRETYLSDEQIVEIWEGFGAKIPARTRAALRGISVTSGGAQKKATVPQGGGGGASVTDSLSWLRTPPERGTGQFNDWLTRVAGFYARKHHNDRKLYEHYVREAGGDYEDLEKTLESVWRTERENHPEREATPDNGWLVGIDRELYCLALLPTGVKGETEEGLMPYANFNILVRGVMVDDDGRRTYQVQLQTRHGDIDTTVNAAILADRRKLTPWLMQYGATIAPYDAKLILHDMDPSVRLQRYLDSQAAPQVQVVDRLGWDHNTRQFVTHDGAIRADAVMGVADSGVIADRSRINHKTAKYHYGFEGDWEEAREVLREVQTYHYPDVVHLMGAWWAACLLKPQAQDHTSLFPYFGVEASSGSAKTNGYFALMVQLGGNYHGQVAATKASFRDSAATSNNGILWADDMDHPDTLQEILRAATSGGTIRKMSEDRTAVDFTLSNPLLLTGEELMVSDQKALLERGVIIHPRPPIDRMSLKPGRGHLPQWADVVDLQNRYRGEKRLTVLAGWYVQRALAVADRFGELVGVFVQEHRGRDADKYAVMRAGARLLDWLLSRDEAEVEQAWSGQGETAVWVDRWVQQSIADREGVEDDNRLTQKVIPWAIQSMGLVSVDHPEPVKFARSWNQSPPVLVGGAEGDSGTLDSREVWVNVRLLAQAWSEAKSGRVNTRLETEESLTAQLSQVAYPYNVERRSVKINRVSTKYRKLREPYAALVMSRVEGGDLTR